MNREILDAHLTAIAGLDGEAMKGCQRAWDAIAKPIAGLGKLEEILVQIAGIQRFATPRISPRRLLIFCADNGIYEEGVSQTAQEVTALVSGNFAKGITCANILARGCQTDVLPVDVGIACEGTPKGVLRKKIARGSKNFLAEDALGEEEMLAAVKLGIDLVREQKEKGIFLIAAGEMGIGNTTTSAALASVLLEKPPETVTGRGAGLSDEAYARKLSIIERGIKNRRVKKSMPLDVLKALGGFDIAALVGVMIGGGMYCIPIVLDGLITAVAALIAFRLQPRLSGYMIPSHLGKEPAIAYIMEELGLAPILHGEFCLGEGTGALLLLPLLDRALEVYLEHNTFLDIGLSPYERFEKK